MKKKEFQNNVIDIELMQEKIYGVLVECLNAYENPEKLREYANEINNSDDYLFEVSASWTARIDREMRVYIHRSKHKTIGKWANLEHDYHIHVSGDFNQDDGNDFRAMVARIDEGDENKQVESDKKFLAEWYFSAFGGRSIELAFSHELFEYDGFVNQYYK